MANLSTTTSVWRSGGGDSTKTASAGSMVMTVPFAFYTTAAAGTNVVLPLTTQPIILPAYASILEIVINSAGGDAASTFDMGLTGYKSGTAANIALLNEGLADTKSTYFNSSAAAGASLGGSPITEMSYVTAGAGATPSTAGIVSGFIVYSIAATTLYTA